VDNGRPAECDIPVLGASMKQSLAAVRGLGRPDCAWPRGKHRAAVSRKLAGTLQRRVAA
jgi:hypothetical protein